VVNIASDVGRQASGVVARIGCPKAATLALLVDDLVQALGITGISKSHASAEITRWPKQLFEGPTRLLFRHAGVTVTYQENDVCLSGK
jgi:hypothetical protein